MIKLKKIIENVNKKILIMTIGISGSGKSEYVKNHFNKNVIVNPDTIREKFTGDINDQSMNIAVWQQVYTDLQTLLDTKGIAVLDATNTSNYYRNIALQRFQSPDIKKIALVFDVNPKIARKKIRKDIKNGKNRADVSISVINKQYQDLKNGFSYLYNQFDEVKIIK